MEKARTDSRGGQAINQGGSNNTGRTRITQSVVGKVLRRAFPSKMERAHVGARAGPGLAKPGPAK